MHGAGIRSMGRLMDSIMPNIDARKPTAKADVIRELKLIAPICRWTSGRWEEMDDIKWNDITHTPRHINVLTNLLIRAYIKAKRGN